MQFGDLNEGDKVSDYRNLAVWQKAHQLALSSYRVTENLMKSWRLY
jgi:hypothetical protein